MSLSDLSIKNPVFAVMLAAAMIVFGYLGYRDMPISQFPELDFPVVSISTNREAAPPEVMDSDVTDVIEDAVAGVEGIDYMQSQSLEGSAITTVVFHLRRDIDAAMQDVQNAVAAARNRLPDDIDPPIISKVNFNKFPVIWLSVHGHKPIASINRFVDDHLKQQILTIPGCGGVMYGGLRSRNMRVWLDAEKLQAYKLDALDVMRAMRAEHVEKPAGYLKGQKRELNVRVMGEARTAREFEDLVVVSRADGQVIRLKDVAVVEDGLSDKRSFARFNREINVGVGVMRATGANVVQVCDEVKRRLPSLRALCPEGVEIGISTDYSLFIRDDIEEMQFSLLLGIVLTAVVTLLFLGSVGTTLNVCVTIPTSLIGTLVAMKVCNFGINFMTLLALSLSVGVVVDDAILVLENIYRRLEHGEPRREAALRGANEISFAAIAATLSIVAIFIPVAFMSGAIGRFFVQFGITVTVAVLLSLVISLTITPMLCSLFLNVRRMSRPRPRALTGLLGPLLTPFRWLFWLLDRWVLEYLIVRPMNALMRGLTWLYGVVLRFALRHQWYVIPASGLLAAAAFVFVFGVSIPLPAFAAGWVGTDRLAMKPMGQELVPSEDQNRFVVNVICPVGSSIEYVDEMLTKAEREVLTLRDPQTDAELAMSMFAAVSIRPGQLITEGTMFVRLVPRDERSLSQAEIIQELRKKLGRIPGMRAICMDLSQQGFTSTRGFPVNFAIQGPDWKTVIAFSETLKQRLIDSGAVSDVDSDYRPGMPEVHVRPVRSKSDELNVSINRMGFALNVAFGGVRSGRFTDDDKRYDVRLRYLEPQRASPDDLDNLFVRPEPTTPGVSPPGLIPLPDLAERDTTSTLPVITRHNHLRKVEIRANMSPGVAQGEAIRRSSEIFQEVREELGLPESYRMVTLGNAQAMAQTLDSMWACLALGFVIAYMILGVQFNSFVHPFTVLLAVPFGVTGALATLYFAGDTLNLMSMIGMILLAGLVKKNSIILVDYTNQLRRQGMGLQEAVLTACPIRLRPIVMTSLATIAAAIPLALGLGAGAETKAPLARSIIGGVLLSTLVTLVVVPIFYIQFDRFGQLIRRLARREKDLSPPRPPRDEHVNGVAGSSKRPLEAVAAPAIPH